MWLKIRRMDDKTSSGSTHQTGTQNLKRNKWLRRAFWALASIAALWGLAWALVPPILKSQLEKIAGEALGRTVTVGKVDFKPWTLELELRDLSIAAASGSGGSASTLVRPTAGSPAKPRRC